MFSDDLQVGGQQDQRARFGVVVYINQQFVFYAKRFNISISSYICQLRQGSFNYYRLGRWVYCGTDRHTRGITETSHSYNLQMMQMA